MPPGGETCVTTGDLALLHLILPIVVALAAAPASPRSDAAGAPGTTAPARPLADRLDTLWAHRDAPKVPGDLKRLAADAGDAPPFEVLWRLARMHCWLADARDAKGQVEADALACWHLGDRAAKAEPTRPEGHYWAAVGVGLVARVRGIAAAFFSGLGAGFQQRLDAALRLDPTYDGCGPLLAKAQLYRQAPWPVHDLGRAERLVRSALEQCPDSLRARLYLAEIDLDRGRSAIGRAALEALVDATAPSDPPEARRVAHLARAHLQTLSDR